MSIFKKLFGGGAEASAPEAPVETYQGFRVTATPVAEGNTYRVSALIEKDVDGEPRSHQLIRADTIQGLEDAQAACFRKAKQVIDEQGERLFR
ncbi:HlyU family transcriptional regulator [Roseobacter sp.]|uniref:HlyU family transcriptional regulator n=1 Tax=Roseobacter sp. TaxID=1907202 RepID=UPI00329A300C